MATIPANAHDAVRRRRAFQAIAAEYPDSAVLPSAKSKVAQRRNMQVMASDNPTFDLHGNAKTPQSLRRGIAKIREET